MAESNISNQAEIIHLIWDLWFLSKYYLWKINKYYRPTFGPKKTVSIIAFRIALTLDGKILWSGLQVTVCTNKRHNNQFLGKVDFNRLNLALYSNCLS